MAKGQNYITVKIDAWYDDNVNPIVSLIIEELVPLCVARVYQYGSPLVCFQCDDTDDNFLEVIRKVRRLGRGKVRFVVISKGKGHGLR